MQQFQYSARGQDGRLTRGLLAAESTREATRKLEQLALTPIRIKAAASQHTRPRKIRSRDQVALYRNLADLLGAGVPLVSALGLFARRDEQNPLGVALAEIKKDVANGKSLSEALKKHPRVASGFAVHIVRAGEEGGFLEDALQNLANFTERSEDLRSRIRGATAYPTFLLGTGVVLFAGIFWFFIPRFRVIFDRLEQRGELPLPTRLLLDTSTLAGNHTLTIVLVLGVLGFALFSWLKTPVGRRHKDRLVLRIWGIGPIVRGFAISRFCRTLGTLLQSGVPIMAALDVSRHVTANAELSEAISEAARHMASGRTLSEPLAASGQFADDTIEMIRVGEDSNRLDQILMRIAESMELKSNRSLDLFLRMLEPMLLLAMSSMILFMLIALLLPVLKSAGALT